MDFWKVIESRHSIREFRPDPVPHDLVASVIRAATFAPSSMNLQPWRFHVTTGGARSELGKIVAQATVHLAEYMDVLGPKGYEDAAHWYSSLGDAPIVIGVSMVASANEFDAMNKQLSVGAAIQNVMLAATAEGLGSCNITFAWWVRDDLASFFGLGKDREVVAIIAMGYPGQTPPVAPQKIDDIVDWLE